jgi:hypothetical protein
MVEHAPSASAPEAARVSRDERHTGQGSSWSGAAALP